MIISNKEPESKPYHETLEPPGKGCYCVLQMAGLVLRNRDTQPDALEYIEREVRAIKEVGGER